MVKKQCALGHRGKRAVAAKRYARKVIVSANAADHCVDALCCLGWGCHDGAAICRDPYQSCEQVPLTARDALLYELDIDAFLRPVLRALSIRPNEP